MVITSSTQIEVVYDDYKKTTMSHSELLEFRKKHYIRQATPVSSVRKYEEKTFHLQPQQETPTIFIEKKQDVVEPYVPKPGEVALVKERVNGQVRTYPVNQEQLNKIKAEQQPQAKIVTTPKTESANAAKEFEMGFKKAAPQPVVKQQEKITTPKRETVSVTGLPKKPSKSFNDEAINFLDEKLSFNKAREFISGKEQTIKEVTSLRPVEKTQGIIEKAKSKTTSQPLKNVLSLGEGLAIGILAAPKTVIQAPFQTIKTGKEFLLRTGLDSSEGLKYLGDTFGAKSLVEMVASKDEYFASGYATGLTVGSIATEKLFGKVGEKLKTPVKKVQEKIDPSYKKLEDVGYTVVEDTTIRRTKEELLPFENKAVDTSHATYNFPDVSVGDQVVLKAFPEATKGYRKDINQFSFYQSLPNKEDIPTIYGGYIGIGKASESSKVEFSLLQPTKKALIFRDQKITSTPKLGSAEEILAWQSLPEQSGKTFLAAENLVGKSSESQVTTPTQYAPMNRIGSKIEIIDTGLTGKKTIYWQKKEPPGILKGSKIGTKIWDVFTEKPYTIELLEAKTVPLKGSLIDNVMTGNKENQPPKSITGGVAKIVEYKVSEPVIYKTIKDVPLISLNSISKASSGINWGGSLISKSNTIKFAGEQSIISSPKSEILSISSIPKSPAKTSVSSLGKSMSKLFSSDVSSPKKEAPTSIYSFASSSPSKSQNIISLKGITSAPKIPYQSKTYNYKSPGFSPLSQYPQLPPSKTKKYPSLSKIMSKKSSLRGGYDVLVRKNKKFVKATPYPLLRGEAMKFGAKIAETTPLASFKIAPSQFSPIKTNMNFTFRPERFRPQIKRGQYLSGDIFIEKNKFRINTRGEYKGITEKGIAARKGGWF